MPKCLFQDPKFISILSTITAVLSVLVIANSVSAQPQFVENVSGSFSQPWGITVDVSGDRLIVANSGANTVSFITLSTGSTTTVGAGTAGYSAVTTGGLAYVATSSSGVQRYSYSGTQTAAFGINSFGVATNGTTLAVTNNSGNGVALYSVSALASTGNLAGVTSPLSAAYDVSGNLFISENGGAIKKFTGGIGSPTTFASGLNSVYGLTVGSSGRIYALEGGFGGATTRVSRFAADGTSLGSFGSFGGGGSSFNQARGITVGTNGVIYIADTLNNRVAKFFSAADWTTSATNSFTATTTFTDSITLDAGKNFSAPTTAVSSGVTVTVNGGTFNPGTLNVTGNVVYAVNSATISLATGSGSGLVSTTGTNQTVNVTGTFGNNLSVAGAGSTVSITGSGAFGSSTLTLAANTSATVSSSGSIAGSVSNGGTLTFNQNAASTHSGSITGVGNVVVSTPFTTTITGSYGHSGGTTIAAGATVAVGSGGTAGSLSGNVINNGSLIVNRSDTVTLPGDISGTGTLTKSGTNIAILSGASTYSGATAVNAGTLRITGSLTGAGAGLTVSADATLDAQGTINRAVSGVGIFSTILANNGTASLGDASSVTGFVHQGTLTVGSNAVTLNSLNFAQMGVNTTLAGGTITAPNGMTFGSGANFSGNGTVNGKVAGTAGSVLTASGGNLTLGANVFGGFFHAGELRTETNTITLNALNQVTLGSVTTLGSGVTAGTLNVANGAIVDFGRAIIGFGTIVSPNLATKAIVVNGNAAGNSSSNRLTFDGYVKGVGSFSNVTFNGTFSPGLSPTISYTTNASLGAASTLEMEIGGTTPGTQHDKIIDSGTLSLNGSLKIVFINGYVANSSHTFDLFDAATIAGTFSAFDFSAAAAPSGFQWDTSSLYSTGVLSFTPVPEPMSILGFTGLLATIASIRRYRRR